MSSGNPMDENPVTFAGLEEWNKRLFEKLGWMHLAKYHITNKNNELRNFGLYKIKMYKKEVKFLGFALINKYDNTDINDKKEDLKILMKQNLILQEAVKNLLDSVNDIFPKITPAMLDSDFIPVSKKKVVNNDIDDILYNNMKPKSSMRNNMMFKKDKPVELNEEDEMVKKNIYQIYNDIKKQKGLPENQDESNNFIGGGKKSKQMSKNIPDKNIPEKNIKTNSKQSILKSTNIKKTKK